MPRDTAKHSDIPNTNLKRAREQRNWSQERLAAELGVTSKTVSRWERGESRPTPYFREQLCLLFEQSAAELGLDASRSDRSSLAESVGRPAPFAPVYDPLVPLPVMLKGGLVGREAEVASVRAWLERAGSAEEGGVVALWGLPGVGKTALAVSLARDSEVREWYGDGVLWAGLGPRANVVGVLARWGNLLGLGGGELAAREGVEAWGLTVRERIGSRRLLVVIDDAWSIDDARALLVGGPNCGYLLTTRSPVLATLFAGQTLLALGELSEEDGLALLEGLAPRAVQEDRDEAWKLVRAVGGLPLALTLMGHYLRVESLGGQPRRIGEALARLQDASTRLGLSQAQVGLERHTSLEAVSPLSLQAVIGASVERLDEQARAALAALAAFGAKPNTFDEQAACAVADCEPAVLDRLSDAGLLESSGGDRHCVHQTIADFAQQQDEANGAHQRLARYMADFVKDHESDIAQLEQDSANILAAAQSAFDLHMRSEYVRIVVGFAHFLEARGQVSIEEYLLGRAQAAAQELGEADALAGVSLYLGRMAQRSGNYTEAEQAYQRGLTWARQSGNGVLICRLLRNLGVVADSRGEYNLAERTFEEALTLARQLEEPILIIDALTSLGVQMLRRGDLERAERYYSEALPLARQANDRERICFLLMGLSETAVQTGDLEQAEDSLREGLKLAQLLGHSELIGGFLANLGAVVRDRGNLEQAQSYLQESIDLLRKVGHHWLIISALLELGDLQVKQERYGAAEATFREIIDLAPQDNQELVATALFGQARVAAAQGNVDLARRHGEDSLVRYEAIGHEQAAHVRAWLQSLPDCSEGLAVEPRAHP